MIGDVPTTAAPPIRNVPAACHVLYDSSSSLGAMSVFVRTRAAHSDPAKPRVLRARLDVVLSEQLCLLPDHEGEEVVEVLPEDTD